MTTLAYIGPRSKGLRALQLAADYYGLRLIGSPRWERRPGGWRVEQEAQ